MAWGTGIEGETPLDDRDGLRDPSIRTREQLNSAEARNIAAAVQKYLLAKPSRRSAKFDVPWLLRLHREMFGQVWSWAGMVRTMNLNIGVDFGFITDQLCQLVDDIAFRESKWDLLEQAVHLHHRAVQIHPFRNGNGRWSRMLANIWLRQHDHRLITWPGQLGVDSSELRQEYLACIRAADNGQFEPLVELHRRFSKVEGP